MAMSQLMSEEDVRQYFLQNNGIVRNTEIVNYFRFYLSDPNIREEARVLFKAYVNKLASVKIENGEKFLVLKRQYFHPIDGNGNGRPSFPPNQYPTSGYGNRACFDGELGLPYPPPAVNVPSSSNAVYYQQQQQQYVSRPFGGHLPRQLSCDAETLSRPSAHVPLQRSLSQVSQHYLGSQNLNNPYRQDVRRNYNEVSSPYQSQAGLPPPQSFSGQSTVLDNQIHDPMFHMGQNPQHGAPTFATKDFSAGLPQTSISQVPRLPVGYSQMPLRSSSSLSRLPPPYRPPPYRPPPPAARVPLGPDGISLHGTRYPPPQPMQISAVQMSQGSDWKSNEQQFRIADYPKAPETIAAVGPEQAGSTQEQTPPPPVPPRSKRASFERITKTVYSGMDELDGNENIVVDGMSAKHCSNTMGSSESGSNGNSDSRRHSESRSERSSIVVTDNDYDKENVDCSSVLSGGDNFAGASSEGSSKKGSGTLNRLSHAEQLLSVKERTQKFDRMASESELGTAQLKPTTSTRQKRDTNGQQKQDLQDFDTASLSSYGYNFGHMQPKEKEWILKASDCDYHALNKLAQENPGIVRKRDINTALHWAAKRGNADIVKLLAGTYKADVNIKSGYTPLHLAAQFSRQDVYDLLVKVYNADPNMRDHSGKKPMQYLVRQDTSVSMDTFNTFKKLKDKRRSAENRDRDRDSSFLRIGSLNVRVKKTTEAFGYLLGKSNSASNIERILHKSWGSADNIPEAEGNDRDADREVMPPPPGTNVLRTMSHKSTGKKKSRRPVPAGTIPIRETHSDSDSDTACGFGSEWKSP